MCEQLATRKLPRHYRAVQATLFVLIVMYLVLCCTISLLQLRFGIVTPLAGLGHILFPVFVLIAGGYSVDRENVPYVCFFVFLLILLNFYNGFFDVYSLGVSIPLTMLAVWYATLLRQANATIIVI